MAIAALAAVMLPVSTAKTFDVGRPDWFRHGPVLGDERDLNGKRNGVST